jgi:amino acid adenylation domain-containing protein
MFALHHVLARAANNFPDHEAIRFADRSLTYGELDAASNGVARALIDSGLRLGDRVALYLPKSPEAVVAAYGIMKAGAAYVPIDPKSPALRAATIAADCSIRALVATSDRGRELLAQANAPRPNVVLMVGEASEPGLASTNVVNFAEATANGSNEAPPVAVIDTDLAYILYTSGSTGVPKGVMLSHRHAMSFVEWSASTIGSTLDDRFSSHAPLHFDLSVFDLYVAAYGGATVCIVQEDEAFFGAALARFIRDEAISVWYSVPSALMMLTGAISDPEHLQTLRAVVFAGEVYPTKHLRELQSLAPRAVLWNLYGPTETNVCTFHRIEELPADDVAIPIGRACENTEVFALREDGRRASVDEVGELYVRGSAVMSGYWGRADLSSEVLVQNPLSPDIAERVYRTGDLVRVRADGAYDFIGRRDHQIKSRGYRIELGEVELALQTVPQLLEAAVIDVPHERWGKAIVAYAVLQNGAPVGEPEIKQQVAKRLPRYMVPDRVEIVPSLPRTSTGKIDRQRLRAEAGR